MKKKLGKKSNAQLIIGALLSGDTLKSRDISQMVEKSEGRLIKIQDVASMLSRISDSNKCDLGYFIERQQVGNGFAYYMVKEALDLSEDKAYGLTLKTGKDKYPLDEALKDFPGLSQYVESPKTRVVPKSKPKKPAPKKAAKPTKPAKPAKPAKPVKKEANAVNAESPEPVAAPLKKGELDDLAAKLIQKIDELGGLNLNLKVSVNLEGSET